MLLCCGSRRDESKSNDGDDGIPDEIGAQIVELNALDDHDAVVSHRGPPREENEATMLARVAGGVQQEGTEHNVDAEDHLVLPIDRRRHAVPKRSCERIK